MSTYARTLRPALDAAMLPTLHAVLLCDDHRRQLLSSAISHARIGHMAPRTGDRGLELPWYVAERGELGMHTPRIATQPVWQTRLDTVLDDGGRYRFAAGQEQRWGFSPGDDELLTDTSVIMTLGEGWKQTESVRTAAAETGARVLSVAIAGCWGAIRSTADHDYLPHPDSAYVALHGRTVILIADSDTRHNEQVQTALRETAHVYAGRGAKVLEFITPDPPPGSATKKWGCDDWRQATGATWADIVEQATLSSAMAMLPATEREAYVRHLERTVEQLRARDAQTDYVLRGIGNHNAGELRTQLVLLRLAAPEGACTPDMPLQHVTGAQIDAYGISDKTRGTHLGILHAAGSWEVKHEPIGSLETGYGGSRILVRPTERFFAEPHSITVAGRKRAGGYRPRCELCGSENVKRSVRLTCLECKHESGLADDGDLAYAVADYEHATAKAAAAQREYERLAADLKNFAWVAGVGEGATYSPPADVATEIEAARPKIRRPEPTRHNGASTVNTEGAETTRHNGASGVPAGFQVRQDRGMPHGQQWYVVRVGPDGGRQPGIFADYDTAAQSAWSHLEVAA